MVARSLAWTVVLALALVRGITGVHGEGAERDTIRTERALLRAPGRGARPDAGVAPTIAAAREPTGAGPSPAVVPRRPAPDAVAPPPDEVLHRPPPDAAPRRSAPSASARAPPA